ncbi:hypothetical protein D3C87_1058040 [compost metagenome]
MDENGEFLYNSLLKAAYVKYFGEGDIVTELELVAERFKAHFAKRKANEMMKLYCMIQYIGDEKKAREFIGDSTWYQYQADLKEVGIMNTPTKLAALRNFSFQIPHPLFTVNHDDSDLKGLYQAYGILPFDEEDEEEPRKRA